MKRLFLVLVVGFFVSIPLIARADWEIGLSGGITYTQGSIRVGSEYDNPIGRGAYQGHHRDSLSWAISLYLKTDTDFLPWQLQAMVRIKYGEFVLDFSDDQHPIFDLKPRVASAAIGINKDFGSLNLFALAGISGMFDLRGPFIEGRGPHPVQHHGNPYSIRPVIAVGAGYLFDLGKVKIGPQITLDLYLWEHGFDLCRDFGLGYVHPSAEIVIWF